jgi:cytochrome d ubiquinol oxidase subunit II
MAYSIFPDIIIGPMTIWAHTDSLRFVFYGVAITLPCMLAYTVFIYRVFSAKAQALSYD